MPSSPNTQPTSRSLTSDKQANIHKHLHTNKGSWELESNQFNRCTRTLLSAAQRTIAFLVVPAVAVYLWVRMRTVESWLATARASALGESCIPTSLVDSLLLKAT
jgi:hypothetical protein